MVTVAALSGFVAQGDTREEALHNVGEVIERYIEDCVTARDPVPLEAGREYVEVRVSACRMAMPSTAAPNPTSCATVGVEVVREMGGVERVFIFGAGFSKPAGMPLATELLPFLIEKRHPNEMREWVEGLCERLAWLSGGNRDGHPLAFNIEQVFHYAYFAIEVCRLQQHRASVGRGDGPGTP